MPVPPAALRELEAFCASRTPSELADRLRLEVETRGSAITIVERRPPWHPAEPEWARNEVARLRHDADAGTWTLQYRGSDERWHRYELRAPTRTVAPLLRELDRDPTGIFWG